MTEGFVTAHQGAGPTDAVTTHEPAAPPEEARTVAEDAAEAIAPELSLLGPLDLTWLTSSFEAVVNGLQRHWAETADAVTRYTADLMKLSNALTPDPTAGDERPIVIHPGEDKRFRHPAWRADPYFCALQQGYLLWGRLLDDLVDAAGLEGDTDQRARFATKAVADAMAPTNFFWTNPEAIERAVETGGKSVVRGLENMNADIEHNGGRPRQVDTTPFRIGENLAATPGSVVYRNPIMELIQYEPQTDRVHEVPLLVSPPWINKYYILDLAPGRSFIEWAVQHGHTVFTISYRNPDHLLREWRLDDYLLHGPHAALDVIEDITGCSKVNVAALCVGGTLTVMLLAWLKAVGEDRVASATLLNTLIDFDEPGALGLFTDPESVERLETTMRRTGYLPGEAMATTFDILRANDLIWNYVARNWLMGETPPAFDILAWNADATRLPEAVHALYLRSCYIENELARGVMELGGQRLHLADVDADVFVVAAQNDHIVPWRSSYRGARLLGGNIDFVLTSSGHIAGVVNPPNPKSRHWTGTTLPEDPDDWFRSAQERPGSWWLTWTKWIQDRAGPMRPPPPTGSGRYAVTAPAPGAYVHEK